MSENAGASSAPGWYPSPSRGPGTRWWDGNGSTDQLAEPVEGLWPMQPPTHPAAPPQGGAPLQPSGTVAGPPAPPAPKNQIWLRALVVVTALLILLVGGRAVVDRLTKHPHPWDGREVYVENEVKLKSCEAAGGGFFFEAAGTLKNHSAKRADYSIDVVF